MSEVVPDDGLFPTALTSPKIVSEQDDERHTTSNSRRRNRPSGTTSDYSVKFQDRASEHGHLSHKTSTSKHESEIADSTQSYDVSRTSETASLPNSRRESRNRTTNASPALLSSDTATMEGEESFTPKKALSESPVQSEPKSEKRVQFQEPRRVVFKDQKQYRSSTSSSPASRKETRVTVAPKPATPSPGQSSSSIRSKETTPKRPSIKSPVKRQTWLQEWNSLPEHVRNNPYVLKRFGNLVSTPEKTRIPRVAMTAKERKAQAPPPAIDDLTQMLLDGSISPEDSDVSIDNLKESSHQLRQLERDMVQRGEYLEAGRISDVRRKVNQVVYKRKTYEQDKAGIEELVSKRNELVALVEAARNDWNAIIENHDQASYAKRRQLEGRQQREEYDFQMNIPEDLTPEFKRYSVALLQMRSKEQNLAVNEQWQAAHAMKQKADRLEAEERDKNFAKMEKFYRRKKKRMRQRHEQELRVQSEYASMRRMEKVNARDSSLRGQENRIKSLERAIDRKCRQKGVRHADLDLEKVDERRIAIVRAAEESNPITAKRASTAADKRTLIMTPKVKMQAFSPFISESSTPCAKSSGYMSPAKTPVTCTTSEADEYDADYLDRGVQHDSDPMFEGTLEDALMATPFELSTAEDDRVSSEFKKQSGFESDDEGRKDKETSTAEIRESGTGHVSEIGSAVQESAHSVKRSSSARNSERNSSAREVRRYEKGSERESDREERRSEARKSERESDREEKKSEARRSERESDREEKKSEARRSERESDREERRSEARRSERESDREERRSEARRSESDRGYHQSESGRKRERESPARESDRERKNSESSNRFEKESDRESHRSESARKSERGSPAKESDRETNLSESARKSERASSERESDRERNVSESRNKHEKESSVRESDHERRRGESALKCERESEQEESEKVSSARDYDKNEPNPVEKEEKPSIDSDQEHNQNVPSDETTEDFEGITITEEDDVKAASMAFEKDGSDRQHDKRPKFEDGSEKKPTSNTNSSPFKNGSGSGTKGDRSEKQRHKPKKTESGEDGKDAEHRRRRRHRHEK